MRKTMLALAMGLLAAMPVQAQQAEPVPMEAVPSVATQPALPADGIRTEATVVVTGEQPGPGMWLVRKGGNELYILGTLNPLPANMQRASAWRRTCAPRPGLRCPCKRAWPSRRI